MSINCFWKCIISKELHIIPFFRIVVWVTVRFKWTAEEQLRFESDWKHLNSIKRKCTLANIDRNRKDQKRKLLKEFIFQISGKNCLSFSWPRQFLSKLWKINPFSNFRLFIFLRFGIQGLRKEVTRCWHQSQENSYENRKFFKNCGKSNKILKCLHFCSVRYVNVM